MIRTSSLESRLANLEYSLVVDAGDHRRAAIPEVPYALRSSITNSPNSFSITKFILLGFCLGENSLSSRKISLFSSLNFLLLIFSSQFLDSVLPKKLNGIKQLLAKDRERFSELIEFLLIADFFGRRKNCLKLLLDENFSFRTTKPILAAQERTSIAAGRWKTRGERDRQNEAKFPEELTKKTDQALFTKL